jgi:hypothetical protein
MICISNSLGCKLPCLLAVLIVCLFAEAAGAQTVVFRNELKIPLVVQTATVMGGVLRRDQSCLVRPGESTPKIKTDVNKVITIFHGRTNQALFRDVIKANRQDRLFGIVVEPAAPGRPARVNVIQRTMPAGMGEAKPTMPKR